MNCNIIKKSKIFFIAVLVVLVAGLTLFGIFGFNQAVDYRCGYEIKVSVDQKAGNASAVMKDATDAYFDANGVKIFDYATQTLEDGMTVIYKLSSDITSKKDALISHVQKALDEKSSVKGVTANVEIGQTNASDSLDVGGILLALGLSVLGIFVYVLIKEKLASAVATVFSAVLSAVAFVAFMGITRIPAAPFVAVCGALSVILASALSSATVNKYRVEMKNNEKASSVDIVNNVAIKAKRIYIYVSIAVALIAVALCAFAMPYLIFTGLQVLVAGLCGISSAIFATPFMWSLIKK